MPRPEDAEPPQDPAGERPAAEQGAPPSYEAERVRQGEIILRTRRRRIVFIGGLVGLVLLGLVLRACAGA